MQKELYQIERSEVSLNISEGAVTEVRRKHIVRSGCRVYDGGKLGISGVFGEPIFFSRFAHLVLCCGLSLLRQIGAAVADACLCKHGIPCKIRRDGRGGAHTGVDQQYGAAHLLNRLL